jgi:short-subunit dehydrogenase
MKMSGLPNWLWLTSERVAEDAWSSAQAGKAICIPGRQYQVISKLARYAPRSWVRKLGMNLGSRRGRNR